MSTPVLSLITPKLSRGLSTPVAGGRARGGRIRRLLKWTLGGAVVVIGGVVVWKQVSQPHYTLPEGKKRKKVVVLGSGWGALSVLNHLTPGQFDVTVVSPRNYFLFTPLLPSVTVGTVESRSIVEPIRKLIQKRHKATPIAFLEAECVGIDHTHKHIQCEDRSAIVGEVSKWDVPYDLLVIAVGAKSNTFGTPGVEEHCHFLKEIPDAHAIRNDIIDLVETASIPGQSQAEQERLLHFVVVGGGPTGVEFAAEVQDFLREDVSKIYPGIHDRVKVSLVQSRDHILNTYDQTISEYTEKQFHSDKINLITNAR
jgi:NADH:ubiquinone reductase (non-electrogenic)